MVDAVVFILIEKLLEGVLNEGRKVLEFHEEFEKMKNELPHLGAILKVTNRVRTKDKKKALKLIAGEIRDLLYDAEDITEGCELYLKKHERRMTYKCICYFSLSLRKYRRQIGKRMSQINQDIGDCKERLRTHLPTIPSSSNEERVLSDERDPYPILMNDVGIVDLQDDVKKIKGWIVEAHDSLTLKVIGIVGMDRIEKTTLARMIYNDRGMILECFEVALFVTVSQSLNFEELIKNMLRKLCVKEESLITDDVKILLTMLRQCLDGKRYMVILDDVWEIDDWWDWESLKSALPQSTKGCCVMITTMNDAVAQSMGVAENHVHHLEILSNEESWSLFAQIAFAREGGECPSLEIERAGKDIVGKCGRLSLAIKFIAGVMLGKGHSLDEWWQISEHLNEELVLHDDDKISASMWLSYDELPTALKPCMLCFAAFPRDHIIYQYHMIYWWIGEGFVREKFGRTAFEIGTEYFDELISRGLLLGIDKELGERRFLNCKVHDRVREMIIKIAKEENFMGLDDNGMPCCENRSRRVGLFMRTNMDELKKTNSQVLRTIMGMEIEESEEFALNVRTLFFQLKWLRVLNIAFEYGDLDDVVPSEVDWWSGIGSLQHLICLQIERSCLDRLPDSIGNLQNLQALCIINCPKLTSLPTQVTSLEKITKLEISGCASIKYLPKGIGELSNLESLGCFQPANSNVEDGCRLSDLKMLTQLRNLSLWLTSEDQLVEGELEVLVELKKLETLQVGFQHAESNEQMVRKVDHDLLPLQKLQQLHIQMYPGQRTPAWLNPTTLPNLKLLSICYGNIRCMSIAFFGNNEKFWELEILSLKYLGQLEEDWLRMKMAMPSLRHQEIVGCSNLKSHPSMSTSFPMLVS